MFKRLLSRRLLIAEVGALCLVPVILFLCAYYQLEYTVLLTLAIVTASLLPFFISFEARKPRPRDFMPIVVLAALAAAGRIICGPLPNIMPITAIVIVAGATLGRDAGFLTGALAALTSNMFFGQGPWTPWQMYGWGLIGFVAGLIYFGKEKPHIGGVLIFGCLSSFIYGFILDSWHVVGFISPLTWQSALAGYGAGFIFNCAHALSTVAFLTLIFVPWSKKLERIKMKFGIRAL